MSGAGGARCAKDTAKAKNTSRERTTPRKQRSRKVQGGQTPGIIPIKAASGPGPAVRAPTS
eukprot:9119800-Pyramimonas_sp.AAC.1